MRFWAIFFVVSGWVFTLNAQNTNNPFELSPRLAPAAQIEKHEEGNTASETNPFDLDRAGRPTTSPNESSAVDASGNPFDLVAPTKPVDDNEAASGEEEASDVSVTTAEGTTTDGSLLLITLLLLGAGTLSIIFFRGMYVKAYRALFNDNLLSQLYREREAGALGVFLITYAVFFLAAGFFTVLALRHWGYLEKQGLWSQFMYITAGIAGLMVFKHLLLAIIGYVFPVQKETSRYSFTIMIFAIVLGLFLTVGTAMLAYIPIGYQTPVIYICLGTMLAVYLLRSFRGLFIANRFIFNYQFHFLSYICAVEIGPALCLFKYLTDF